MSGRHWGSELEESASTDPDSIAVGSARAVRRPLVGREVEAAGAVDLMRTAGVRLVTVTGGVGVGKTTLADEVVRRLMILDPVGVGEVRLSARSGPVELGGLTAVLAGLGAGHRAPEGRTRLVLIDGAERHLGSIARSLAAALDSDPDLAVLVTSTRPLGLRGEQVVRLDPLELPDPRADGPEGISRSPAVALFVERARAAAPDVVLDGAAMLDVARICRRLDGLPLALELAAARCAVLSPAEVGDLLDTSVLDLTAGGAVDREPHHRSLRDAVHWSYRLLDDDARRLLRHLGVFIGPFGLDDALAVVPHPAPSTIALVDQLTSLSGAGLVQRVSGDRPAYCLAGAVRAAALELLEAEGEARSAQERHAELFRSRIEHVAPELRRPRSWAVQQQLRPHWSDLIAALQVLTERDDLRPALHMALHLQPLWTEANATQGAALLGQLAQDVTASAGPGAPEVDYLVAAAGAAIADLQFWGAEVDAEPGELLRHAIETGDRFSEHHLSLFARQTLVQLLVTTDPVQCLPVALDAVEVAESSGDRWWTASLTSWAAVAANQAGDTSLALELAVRSQALSLSVGDEWQMLRTSVVLGGIPGAAGTPGAYLPPLAEQLEIARRVGDDQVEGWLAAAIALERSLGGDLQGAAAALRDGLWLAQRLGRWSVEQLCVAALVLVISLADRPDDAVRLHGGLLSRLGDIRGMLSPSQYATYEVVIDGARTQLGEARFDDQVTSGRLMPWRAVLEYAGELLDQLLDPVPVDGAVGSARGPLTERELEVLQLISDGSSNKEIAVQLGLRPKTVMHHSSNIYRKLGVRTRAQAASTALRQGLLPRSGGS